MIVDEEGIFELILKATPWNLVMQVKQQVINQMGLPNKAVRLFFKQDELDNSKLLDTYGIFDYKGVK